MVNEYDYALTEPEEGKCDHLQESTHPEVNVCDPMEPNKEVVYDYPTGVGSGEDEIAARRVEMTPNPAYKTVTVNDHEQGIYIMIIIVKYMYIQSKLQMTLHTVSVFTSYTLVPVLYTIQYLLLL